MNAKLRLLRGAIFALCALFWAGLFFLTEPSSVSAVSDETYFCLWEDGTESEERYFTAFRDLLGIEGESVVLERDGMRGEIACGEACRELLGLIEHGNFGELAAAGTDGASRIEQAALYRRYRKTLFYAGEWMEWTGRSLAVTRERAAEEVVLLEGEIAPERLIAAHAETVYLRAEGELGGATFVGTYVKKVVAQAPYRAEGECVCLDVPGGARLIAGLPYAERVDVPQDVTFADEGALLACSRITELSLPFVGNAKSDAATEYRGELAHLFSTGESYQTPKTLRKLRVTGGHLTSHAFYACPSLEEIDACGMRSGEIEYDAFADCTQLRYLHCPRADVFLRGTFTRSVAPCGCTVFERAEGA